VLNPTREQLYSERSCAEQYRELFLDAVRETNPQVEGRNGDRTRFEDSLGRGFSSGCGFTLMGSDCIRWTESITDAFCTAIEGFSDTVALETAAAVFPHRVAMKSYPAKFVGATLSNPDVDLDARLHVLESVSRSSDQDARARAVLEQHDFVPIFASDDPMVPYIVRCFRLALKGSDRRIVYAKTLVENPRTQAIALKLFFETDPEYRAVMSEALASEDQGRISAAKASVLAGRTEVILPLLHEILAMDPHQTDTIDRLVEFADARSIEPLAKLLDSNDYSQRKVALEALEKIEDTLKKRSKWRGR